MVLALILGTTAYAQVSEETLPKPSGAANPSGQELQRVVVGVFSVEAMVRQEEETAGFHNTNKEATMKPIRYAMCCCAVLSLLVAGCSPTEQASEPEYSAQRPPRRIRGIPEA